MTERYSAPTPHQIAACISGTCVIASIAFSLIAGLALGSSGGPGILTIAGCAVAVKVIFFLTYIAFVVQGFRVHWGWGVANLILGPLAGIVFFVNHRQQGGVPIYLLVHGLILFAIISIYVRL